MKNKECSNILTRHINLFMEVPEEIKNNEELMKKYISERYEFLRNGRYAGNRGFNLVMSSVYRAKYLGQGEKDVEAILYSYSHSENDGASGLSIDKLMYLKNLAPITEEIIKDELKKYTTAIKRKKKKTKDKDKEELTKTDLKKIDAEEKKLRKFIGLTADDIQFEIDKKQQYNKFPEDINDKWMNGYKQPQRIVRSVESFWKSSLGSDVLAGRSSLPNRKLDDPIFIPKDLLYNNGFTGLYHEYGDYVKKILTDKDQKVFLKLPYKKGEPYMVFRMDLGRKPNNIVRDFIYKIFVGEIEPCDCQLNFTENKKTHKDTDLTLFLAGNCKVKEHKLDYDKVMGIDLGWNNPVAWAVNYDTYTHDFLGDIELKKKRIAQIDKEIKNLQKSISVHGRGGHGYKRKCEALAKVKSYKRNFNKTFNDRISTALIKKCIQLGIGTIKMEDLSDISKKDNGNGISKKDDEFKNMIMSNWCYYELQKMIEYKAASNGIEVYYVESAMTSQTCAFCGEKGTRGVWDNNGKMIDSSKFFCNNASCESKKINWKNGTIHADRNAAMNIARSEKYVEKRNEGLWRRNSNNISENAA